MHNKHDYDAIKQLTSYLHGGHGMTYDSENWGGCQFTTDSLGGTLELTDYMDKSAGTIVNCADQAAAVLPLARLVGIPANYKRLSPFGFIPECDLVGRGNTNNPFWLSHAPPLAKVAGADAVQPDRDPFGWHAFVQCATTGGGAKTRIYDACVGPHLGTEDFNTYYNNAHDDSTADEDLQDSEAPHAGLVNGSVTDLN